MSSVVKVKEEKNDGWHRASLALFATDVLKVMTSFLNGFQILALYNCGSGLLNYKLRKNGAVEHFRVVCGVDVFPPHRDWRNHNMRSLGLFSSLVSLEFKGFESYAFRYFGTPIISMLPETLEVMSFDFIEALTMWVDTSKKVSDADVKKGYGFVPYNLEEKFTRMRKLELVSRFWDRLTIYRKSGLEAYNWIMELKQEFLAHIPRTLSEFKFQTCGAPPDFGRVLPEYLEKLDLIITDRIDFKSFPKFIKVLHLSSIHSLDCNNLNELPPTLEVLRLTDAKISGNIRPPAPVAVAAPRRGVAAPPPPPLVVGPQQVQAPPPDVALHGVAAADPVADVAAPSNPVGFDLGHEDEVQAAPSQNQAAPSQAVAAPDAPPQPVQQPTQQAAQDDNASQPIAGGRRLYTGGRGGRGGGGPGRVPAVGPQPPQQAPQPVVLPHPPIVPPQGMLYGAEEFPFDLPESLTSITGTHEANWVNNATFAKLPRHLTYLKLEQGVVTTLQGDIIQHLPRTMIHLELDSRIRAKHPIDEKAMMDLPGSLKVLNLASSIELPWSCFDILPQNLTSFTHRTFVFAAPPDNDSVSAQEAFDYWQSRIPNCRLIYENRDGPKPLPRRHDQQHDDE